jgi:hypothetical protein
MHKINRIGYAALSIKDAVDTVPAIAYTGSTLALTDSNFNVVNTTNLGQRGGLIQVRPSGTFTHTGRSKCGYGIQAAIDVPYADSLAIEYTVSAIGDFASGIFATSVVGHLNALATVAMETEVLTDYVEENPINNPSVYSARGAVVLRRNSALPFQFGIGLMLTNVNVADSTARTLLNLKVGYRTLDDQYESRYYDPAR